MNFKKLSLTLLSMILFFSDTGYGDTCPSIQEIDPFNPPTGWTLQIPPIIDGQEYYFSEAIHSMNGSFYFKQVICKYQACASAFCPAFSLLSNKQYAKPNTNAPPWDTKSRIAFTFTCRPIDNNPTNCIFQ